MAARDPSVKAGEENPSPARGLVFCGLVRRLAQRLTGPPFSAYRFLRGVLCVHTATVKMLRNAWIGPLKLRNRKIWTPGF
jgi:hypothetical protein